LPLFAFIPPEYEMEAVVINRLSETPLFSCLYYTDINCIFQGFSQSETQLVKTE
jgi:hypothetical protein